MRINGKTPREIMKISSFRELLEWIPASFAQILILSAFALVMLAPLRTCIKALSYFKPLYLNAKSGKYFISTFYTYDFDRLMHKTVFPYIGAAAVLAYLLSAYKGVSDGSLARVKRRRDTSLVLFCTLAVWVLINVFFVNGPTFYALKGATPPHENIYIYLLYYLCLFPIGLFLTNRPWKYSLLRFFALLSLALIPFAVCIYAKEYTNDLIRCVFSNSNYYGILLNVVISLCASMMVGETHPRWRWFFTAALVINTVVLYFNNTFGAWVGVFFACLFSILAFRIRDGKWNRRALLAFILFLSCLIVCGFVDAHFISGKNNFTQNILALIRDIFNIKADPNSSVAGHAGSGRWKIWKYYLGLVREHPWFGVGLDGVRALDIGQEINQKRPHNEYLQYAAYFGIPALVLYFSACLSVFIRAIKYRKHLDNLTLAALTAAFGYLVGAFFGNTVYNTTPYLYIMLGLGYVQFNGANDK